MRRALIIICLAALSLLLNNPTEASTRRVPADYPSIQLALSASVSGDMVLVDPGTYFENLTLSLTQDGVALKSSGGAEVTTIDGQHLGTVIECSNVGPSTLIEGFTIIHGGQSPLSNLVGGGLALLDASPTIRNNVITENVAAAAGGIYASGGSAFITDNIIRGNDAAGGSGGGVYCDNGASPLISNNLIIGNHAGAYGGGVTAWVGSSPSLIRNTIVLNQSVLDGGGIYAVRGSYPTAGQDIIAFNSGSGVVVSGADAGKSLTCVDAYANTPSNYSGLPDPTGINGNISTDPSFCDLSASDFRLASTSPCAEANSAAGCGQIGALGVGCSLTPITRMTWGHLKASYR